MADVLSCYAGWLEARVSVDGTVSFCTRCDRALGNVNERPLEAIWMEKEYQMLRKAARSPSDRSKIGSFDCKDCCETYRNWYITRLLSRFRMAPEIDDPMFLQMRPSPSIKAIRGGLSAAPELSSPSQPSELCGYLRMKEFTGRWVAGSVSSVAEIDRGGPGCHSPRSGNPAGIHKMQVAQGHGFPLLGE